MTYGQRPTGIPPTMLLAQRRAVAATQVASGAGDLDLRLIVADGSAQGKADPAFEAHEAPIGSWAATVWKAWLARPVFESLLQQAVRTLTGANCIWSHVRWPCKAVVASAWRSGWVVDSPHQITTDVGAGLNFLHDSPALVRTEVAAAVRRWRWRIVEDKPPMLQHEMSGSGAWIGSFHGPN